ncbi:hypothetical protein DSC47_10735 [Elizabethkingia miricola]|nr:hypothetical protein DSC47_10735 [Elizabethkingia miricola]
MIYLIDDKRERQKDFGWSDAKFAQFVNVIKPLYNIEDVVNIGEDLYANGNIILYHESFLDFTESKDKALQQRSKLVEKAKNNQNLSVAFFSGSQSSRSLNSNVAHLPVAIVYQNLVILISQYSLHNNNLNYLLFGKYPEIEENLSELHSQASREIENETVNIQGNNLFVRPNSNYIQNAIFGATETTIFLDVSDEKFSEKVVEWLNKEEYDNIFIPACFGQTLSDFNGLRLATHIRCTESPNQLKRIFIYSFVGLEYLLQNEYFNILKTKGVELVDYSKKAFQLAASQSIASLTIDELPKEIEKLELQPPKNYQDNHSIANEWAIHQWAKTIGCEESDELVKVFQNVQTNLYFKYLRTTNPISEIDKISPEKLKFIFKGAPKVLLIDDEADKGWYEIFAYLLGDLNKIYTDSLGIDFKKLSSEEIIEKSIEKILNDDIHVVILDFRLNPSDFENKNIEDITSIKLLKEIKERNLGVQVIAFSATNKVWNLQALQNAGTDVFIFKDGGKNIIDAIDNFIKIFKSSIEKSILLKPLNSTFNEIQNFAANLSEKFKINLEANLSICFELLLKSFINPKYRNYAYLQLFLIVEEFIKEDSVFERGNNCYVNIGTSHYLVLSKTDPTNKNSSAKSAIEFINGHYQIQESIYKRSIDSNFIISALLLFRYGCETSGEQNWTKIYTTRNKKAAHPEVGIVNFNEINTLTEFLKFILNESNIKPIDYNKGLKESSPEEQVENLKKIWGAK